MKKRETGAAIFWILLGVTAFVWSATFPFGSWKAPGPGFLPLILGLILILLGGTLFFQTIMRKDGGDEVRSATLLPGGAAFRRVGLTLAILVLSVGLLEYLGFILTAFFLILLTVQAIQPRTWRFALFYALVSALSSSLLFQVLLKTQLPRGPLGL